MTMQIRYLQGGDAELQGYLFVIFVFVSSSFQVAEFMPFMRHFPAFPRG